MICGKKIFLNMASDDFNDLDDKNDKNDKNDEKNSWKKMTLFDDTFYCAFEKRTLLTLSFLSAHTRARTHAHARAHHQAWWWCFDE